MIKGYKVLDMNMEAVYGDGVIGKINKRHDDTVEECKKLKYQYFTTIRDIMVKYDILDYRIFECEVTENANCINDIKLGKELTIDDIKKYIEDNLNELVNDEKYGVRFNIAKLGYGLDILLDDESWVVRKEVTKQGYGLDKLVDDENIAVRNTAREKLYGIDKLINVKTM